jgi:hypothetical protein
MMNVKAVWRWARNNEKTNCNCLEFRNENKSTEALPKQNEKRNFLNETIIKKL